MNVEFRMFNYHTDWDWCNQQVGIKWCEDTNGIMAIDMDTNTTVGGFMMDNWTANSVQCHFMLTSPLVLKHGFLECCAEFVYTVCKVERVYALVPANNEKAIKLNLHMGFTEKARMEEAFEKGVDYLLMEMKQENCIHLPKPEKVARHG